MAEYETDFYGWTQAQAQALRAKDWAALDVDHLAEEIEDVGNSGPLCHREPAGAPAAPPPEAPV